ncbi:MAG: hypothetical protein NTX61_14160 [Bacteroidetes bacterium]|nr:hypothetical protein [Bacteroidota bacterium]
MKQKILHWLPRILCILAIPFISLFALDSFNGDQTFWQKIGAFIIHLIPSYVMILLTFIAWKKEFIGGILLILISLVAGYWIGAYNYATFHSVKLTIWIVITLSGPFLLAGALFIVSYRYSKKVTKAQSHK